VLLHLRAGMPDRFQAAFQQVITVQFRNYHYFYEEIIET
jgi:hypothetical protein